LSGLCFAAVYAVYSRVSDALHDPSVRYYGARGTAESGGSSVNIHGAHKSTVRRLVAHLHTFGTFWFPCPLALTKWFWAVVRTLKIGLKSCKLEEWSWRCSQGCRTGFLKT